MTGYLCVTWPPPPCVFIYRDEVEVHKNAERELGQYPAILTELPWSIKNLLYNIPRLLVGLCFCFYVCRFLLQNLFSKLVNIFVLTLSVFSFSSSIPTEKSQKIFSDCHGKFLWKKTFVHPIRLRRNFIAETKRAI